MTRGSLRPKTDVSLKPNVLLDGVEDPNLHHHRVRDLQEAPHPLEQQAEVATPISARQRSKLQEVTAKPNMLDPLHNEFKWKQIDGVPLLPPAAAKDEASNSPRPHWSKKRTSLSNSPVRSARSHHPGGDAEQQGAGPRGSNAPPVPEFVGPYVKLPKVMPPPPPLMMGASPRSDMPAVSSTGGDSDRVAPAVQPPPGGHPTTQYVTRFASGGGEDVSGVVYLPQSQPHFLPPMVHTVSPDAIPSRVSASSAAAAGAGMYNPPQHLAPVLPSASDMLAYSATLTDLRSMVQRNAEEANKSFLSL